jgi:hypothetical protein
MTIHARYTNWGYDGPLETEIDFEADSFDEGIDELYSLIESAEYTDTDTKERVYPAGNWTVSGEDETGYISTDTTCQ